MKNSRNLVLLIESIKVYVHNKYWILLTITVLLVGFVITSLSSTHTDNKLQGHTQHPKANNQTSEILSLEKEIQAVNRTIGRLNNDVNEQLNKTEEEMQVDANRRKSIDKLAIQKLETMLTYAETPIGQFNQIPLFPLNDSQLVRSVEQYNHLQIVYFKDRSTLPNVQFAQQTLIGTLKDKIRKEHQINERRSKTKQTAPVEQSATLEALFTELDSVTEKYHDLLEQYQTTLKHTAPLTIHRGEDTTASTSTVINSLTFRKPSSSTSIAWLSVSILSTIILPIGFIFYRKYRHPKVVRPQDIATKDPVIYFHPKKATLSIDDNDQSSLKALTKIMRQLQTSDPSNTPLIGIYSLCTAEERFNAIQSIALFLAKEGHSVILLHLVPTQTSDAPIKLSAGGTLLDWINDRNYTVDSMLKKDRSHDALHHIYLEMGDKESSTVDANTLQEEFSQFKQKLLLKERTKDLLRWLKRSYDYSLVSTPPLTDIHQPLLYIPYSNMSINIFYCHITNRKDAEKLCRLSKDGNRRSLSILVDQQEKEFYN
ncbi:hypothetical protein H8S90_20670 [Olivibacter sp. SDN3]|uniref:hypothetical protein n=1 Tax=Olivibacter sp. SDN3 TaxID=2764720 RepID=UPI0016516268|nr:hypothetical protein [Olivibacter sp. SDN3]QNL49132.1 hypothetical protein H8S90_20670 [Olivibacter sp. SDN3]